MIYAWYHVVLDRGPRWPNRGGLSLPTVFALAWSIRARLDPRKARVAVEWSNLRKPAPTFRCSSVYSDSPEPTRRCSTHSFFRSAWLRAGVRSAGQRGRTLANACNCRATMCAPMRWADPWGERIREKPSDLTKSRGAGFNAEEGGGETRVINECEQFPVLVQPCL